MNIHRGNVVLIWFPFSSGEDGKVRPALIVQSDHNNSRLTNVIVVGITTTKYRSGEATQLLITLASSEGQQSGLAHDSVVTCENIATVDIRHIRHTIGSLPQNVMKDIDVCIKNALDIQ